jgi:hypothetical protein
MLLSVRFDLLAVFAVLCSFMAAGLYSLLDFHGV